MAQKTQGTELFLVKDDSTIQKIGKVTGVTGTGGARSQIDVTNLDSVENESIPGLAAPGAVSTPLHFDPSNLTHQYLMSLYQDPAQPVKKWIIGLSDGTATPTIAIGEITYPTTRTYREFNGFVSDMPVEAALNSKLESNVTIQRSGPITNHWKAAS